MKQKRRKKENGIRMKTRIFPLFLSNAERKLKKNREETNCPKNKQKKGNLNKSNSNMKPTYTNTNIRKKGVQRKKYT